MQSSSDKDNQLPDSPNDNPLINVELSGVTPTSETLDQELQSYKLGAERTQSEFTRSDAWLDEWSDAKLRLFKLGVYLAHKTIFILTVTLLTIVLVSALTLVIHLFIPQAGWLTEAQEKRLTAWYTSLARIAFPVLLIMNPWVIWRITRGVRLNDR